MTNRELVHEVRLDQSHYHMGDHYICSCGTLVRWSQYAFNGHGGWVTRWTGTDHTPK